MGNIILSPYTALWNWVFGVITNVQFFVFVLLVVTACILYNRRKSKVRKREPVSYRRVKVNPGIEGKVNVVVTGGNGCLADKIVKYLLQDGGYNVHSLDLWIPEDKDRNPEVCSYIQTDITNLDDLMTALMDSSAVFHAASVIPHKIGFSSEDYFRINTKGTENVIKACQACGVKRLIYTSSASLVLSKNHYEIINQADESHPLPSNPVNSYIASKQAAERLVRAANGKNGFATCAMRPSGLFGGTKNQTMSMLVKSRVNCFTGDGKYPIDLSPIDATARAHILAEKKLCTEGPDSIIAGKAYNLSMTERVPYIEILKYIHTELHGPPYMSIPIWVLVVASYLNTYTHAIFGIAVLGEGITTLVGDGLRDHSFSSALAHRELGWEELPSWKEFIREYVEEYRRETETKKQR